jgi:hypothetical protein
MQNRSKTVCVGSVCFVAVLIGGGIVYGAFFAPMLTKNSPSRRHTAKLWRSQAIDVNYTVAVDGDVVYRSADFAPVNADFREQLYWNADGDAVLLEIAGTKLFGYNAAGRRTLSDEELNDFRPTPFETLRFEGILPNTDGG